MKKLLLLLIGIIALVLPCIAWNISIDKTSPNTIVWNVSQKTGLISSLYLDGLSVTGFNTNASLIVQQNLNSNSLHEIRITSGGNLSTKTAMTNMSAAESVNSNINKWFYLGIILLLFFCGFAIHWFLFWVGSGVSLYALAEYISTIQTIDLNMINLQFLIYGALFILGFVLWAFRKKKGYR
jgi:hypothetical protein